MHRLVVEKLSATAFAPFGNVIETDDLSAGIEINDGFARRFDDLATIDIASEDGGINVAIFCAQPRQAPFAIRIMERHPLGSQLFFPLREASWLVVVCTNPAIPVSYRAFRATGRQGVNYARGVWHHPLLVLENDHRFVVLDRAGPGENLVEYRLTSDSYLEVQEHINEKAGR